MIWVGLILVDVSFIFILCFATHLYMTESVLHAEQPENKLNTKIYRIRCGRQSNVK